MRDTIRSLDALGVRHAGCGESQSEATRLQVLTVAGQSVAFFSFCSALPRGANATGDRPGVAAIRVRSTFEVDSGLLDETPGVPPFVHTHAYEPDVQRAEVLMREAKAQNVLSSSRCTGASHSHTFQPRRARWPGSVSR
ncbi:CapA family protein [Mycolicibacterium smegmatis]|uniref:CapA family protein n=1 Tax=Mycolicibacterium smegmatis TaxID=1772 RepID=UPI0009B78AC1